MTNETILRPTFTDHEFGDWPHMHADVVLTLTLDGELAAVPCWQSQRHTRKPVLRPWTIVTFPKSLPSWSVRDQDGAIVLDEPLVEYEATVLNIDGRPVRVAVRPCFGYFHYAHGRRLPEHFQDWEICGYQTTMGQCISRLISGPIEQFVKHVIWPSRAQEVLALDDGDRFETHHEEVVDEPQDLEYDAHPELIFLSNGLVANFRN